MPSRWAVSILRYHLKDIKIPIMKIRRSPGFLILLGIPIPRKTSFMLKRRTGLCIDTTTSDATVILSGSGNTAFSAICVPIGLKVLRERHVVIIVQDPGLYSTTNCNTMLHTGKQFQRRMIYAIMVTSPNGNSFRVTGPLWGEFPCHRWIPIIKSSDAGLWSALE